MLYVLSLQMFSHLSSVKVMNKDFRLDVSGRYLRFLRFANELGVIAYPDIMCHVIHIYISTYSLQRVKRYEELHDYKRNVTNPILKTNMTKQNKEITDIFEGHFFNRISTTHDAL